MAEKEVKVIVEPALIAPEPPSFVLTQQVAAGALVFVPGDEQALVAAVKAGQVEVTAVKFWIDCRAIQGPFPGVHYASQSKLVAKPAQS